MKSKEVMMDQFNLPDDVNVSSASLVGLVDTLRAVDNMTGDDVCAALIRGVKNGLLIKKAKDGKTREERAAGRTEKQNIEKEIYVWLRDHSGPMYDGSRENAYNAAEILDKIGIERSRRSLTVVRNVLESESTGWGLVDRIEGQRLYAKKAALLVFRKAA